MTRPPLKTRVLGHPTIALPVMLATLWVGYLAFTEQNGWFFALPMAFVANATMKANETMLLYDAWKRAWDGMAPAKPARVAVAWRKPITVLGIMATVAYLAATIDQPGHAFALGWTAVGSVVLVTYAFVGRWRARHPRVGRTELVTIAVKRRLLPVPDLATAIRTLPPHCHQVMPCAPNQP